MPHCIIEYSSNVKDSVNFPEFFKRLHELLASSSDIQLDQLKSRWLRREDYFIGDGSPQNAFVYLQISLMTGRTLELRKQLGQSALDLLASYFPRTQAELSCSMTVEMREMERETHFKITKGGAR